jgi:hypothetical protein
VRELGINSPGVLQIRKEEIEVEDLIGDGFGRKSGRRLEEEGGPDGGTRGVSRESGETGEHRRARRRATRAGASGPRRWWAAGELVGCWAS